MRPEIGPLIQEVVSKKPTRSRIYASRPELTLRLEFGSGGWESELGRLYFGPDFLVSFCDREMAGSEEKVSEGSNLKSAAVMEQVKHHLATDAGKELKRKIGLVYQINISPKKIGVNEEVFVVDLKNGQVTKGPYEGKPDATFSFVDDDFISVVTGKINPQIAFMRGKMKIKGSMSAAQKFTPDIFPKPSKL